MARLTTSPWARRYKVRALLAALLGIALASGGCAARRRTEALEARLRQQEDRLVTVHRDLIAVRRERDLARAETEQLRLAAQQRGESVLLPEQSAALVSVEGIRLGGLLTGGLDQDGAPGDDALAVMVVPHDADGELIKIPGSLEVEVLDLSRSDEQRIVGQWSFTLDEARELWHRGFVGSGYRLVLPWQRPPGSAELIVHARFKTLDGRTFDDTQSVTIQPPTAPPTPPRSPAANSAENNPHLGVLPASATTPSIDDEPEDDWQADPRGQLSGAAPHDFRWNDESSPTAGGNPFADDPADGLRNPFLNEPPQQTSDAWDEHTIPRLR